MKYEILEIAYRVEKTCTLPPLEVLINRTVCVTKDLMVRQEDLVSVSTTAVFRNRSTIHIPIDYEDKTFN